MSNSSPGSAEKEKTHQSLQEATTSKESKIINSSSSNRSRNSVPICKHFISNRSCPYGNECRYRHSPPTQQRICQHFLSSQCRYGNQCKFLHVRDREGLPLTERASTSSHLHLLDVHSFPSIATSLASSGTTPTSLSTTPPLVTSSDHTHHFSPPRKRNQGSQRRDEPLKLEAFFQRAAKIDTRPAVSRPKFQKSEEPLVGLRDVEIEQLKKRYYGDQHQLVEKSSDNVVYIITFSPSDPEWVCTAVLKGLIIKFIIGS